MQLYIFLRNCRMEEVSAQPTSQRKDGESTVGAPVSGLVACVHQDRVERLIRTSRQLIHPHLLYPPISLSNETMKLPIKQGKRAHRRNGGEKQYMGVAQQTVSHP